MATKKDYFLGWIFNNFAPIDIISIVYFFMVFIWMLFPIEPVSPAHNQFLLKSLNYLYVYLAIILFYGFFLKRWKIFKPVYKMSPFITGTYIYEKLFYIIPSVSNYNFDNELLQIDTAILGNDASRILESAFWNTHFIEVMAAFYIIYFGVIYMPFLKKFITKSPLFDIFITGFTLNFLLAFFTNIVVPSLGPKFFFPSDFYQYDLVSGFFMNTCDNMIENLSGGYQAFPSLHFGGPAFVLLFDFFHSRRRFYVYLIPIILVWTSAIFLRYHYITDHIGGLILVCFSLWFAPKFMRFYNKKANYYQEKTGIDYKRVYFFPEDYTLKNPKYHNHKEWL